MIFGMLFCGFAVLAFYGEHGRHKDTPMQWNAFLLLFFIWGLWMIFAGLFKEDAEGALSYFVGSVITAIFAVVAFLFALLQREGWSGGIPFMPHAWSQTIARWVVAGFGLLLTATAIAFFRKALRKRRKA
jgi:magnesium-transporting ATPase (P-type)